MLVCVPACGHGTSRSWKSTTTAPQTTAARLAQLSSVSPCSVTTSTDLSARAAQHPIDLSRALTPAPLHLSSAAINQDGALTALPAGGPGGDEPGAAAQCQWLGAPISPAPPYNFTNTITVTLSIVPWANASLARQAWNATTAAHLAMPSPDSPIGWSTAGVGDAAGYDGVAPEDGSAVLSVLDQQYAFTISVQATSAVFDETPAPWITLAKAVVADLTPTTPAPMPLPLPPQPQDCVPVTGGPDAPIASRLGDSPDWTADAAPAATVLDGVLHNPRDAAGFFNALDSAQVHSLVTVVLRVDSQNQPIDPAVWALFKADLESCWLSEAFVRTLATTPNDKYLLNGLYSNLVDDSAAAVGLFQPMTADEIDLGQDFAGVSVPDPKLFPLVDNEFCKLAGVALGTDIAALLGAGQHFTLPVALELDGLSARAYFDITEPEYGRKGAKNLSDYNNGGWALPNALHKYITATEPPPPPKTLDFTAGNQWIIPQLSLTAGRIPLPNDIYGDPLADPNGPPDTAGLYYFRTWASGATILEYLVARPLMDLQEENILGLSEAFAFVRTLVCAAGGDVTAAVCFLQDLAEVARAELDGNTADSAYATPAVIKDAIEDPAAHALPALGVAFTLIDPALSGPSPATIAAAHAAAGQYLCDREKSLEYQLANPTSRVLEYGTSVQHTVMPGDAYAARPTDSQPVATFAYAGGSDTGSGVFVLLNLVQALFTAEVNGQLSPSDYETCLSGQDPTLAQDQVPLAGSGYAPNSVVIVTGHSVPAGLAATRTDAAGRFSIRIDPRPLGRGEHRITATGRAPDGATRQLTWTIHVGNAQGKHSWPPSGDWFVTGIGLPLVLAAILYLRQRRRPARTQPPKGESTPR